MCDDSLVADEDDHYVIVLLTGRLEGSEHLPDEAIRTLNKTVIAPELSTPIVLGAVSDGEQTVGLVGRAHLSHDVGLVLRRCSVVRERRPIRHGRRLPDLAARKLLAAGTLADLVWAQERGNGEIGILVFRTQEGTGRRWTERLSTADKARRSRSCAGAHRADSARRRA